MNAAISPIKRRKDSAEKSKNSFFLIDYLENRKKKILLAKSDSLIPDMYKAHTQHFGARLAVLYIFSQRKRQGIAVTAAAPCPKCERLCCRKALSRTTRSQMAFALLLRSPSR